MGRAAPPGRHGRAEGRYMPKAGKTSSTARGTTACRRGRGRTSSDRYLCVSMRVYAYEKELDRPMTEPLAELQGVPFGADGRLSCTYTQKFPANPGAGRDNRVIDQPVAAPLGKASMDTRHGRGRPGNPRGSASSSFVWTSRPRSSSSRRSPF